MRFSQRCSLWRSQASRLGDMDVLSFIVFNYLRNCPISSTTASINFPTVPGSTSLIELLRLILLLIIILFLRVFFIIPLVSLAKNLEKYKDQEIEFVISDSDTDVEKLTVVYESSNPQLITNAHISSDGIVKIEMHFLPDVYVPCDVCHGARYNRDTLEVHYKGKSIADVLDMTVSEACEFFKNLPKIYRKLEVLEDVGLGYIHLGQAATTLSGGEAQRVKLATELSRRSTGRTVYILDEPTTGLHIADVHKLLEVLQRLVEAGDSVIVIEHNLDVIKVADYIIDLGPEGGDKGGTVVAAGSPEEVSKVKESYTGQYIKRILANAKKNGWYK